MAVPQTISVVPKFDLNRYIGTWHEIAKYPNKVERNCIAEEVVLFALADKPNRFQMVASCRMRNESSDARNADGSINRNGDGKLKLARIWPFSNKYWVFAVGPAYEWALVGDPNHKSLWILSRTMVLTPEVVAEIENKVAAEGFDSTKLVFNR
jgi:apolipoprotein D and lipocalin family protein